MSAFAEFCLVALALFVWESILWIPLRGVCVQMPISRKKLRILSPDRWFATKNSGMIFSSWWPGGADVAVCQSCPLLVDAQGRWLLQHNDGRYVAVEAPAWEDIQWQAPHMMVRGVRVMLTGARMMESLWRGKKAGLTPADAVMDVWRESLSMPRAAGEWKKWRLATASLRWLQPILFTGFVSGLVLYFFDAEQFPLGLFLGWMWLMMVMIACQLRYLSRRLYRSSRGEFLLDAFLCCTVPFHAMRASEIAVRPVLGNIHPFAMVARYDTQNPWLVRQLRQIAHPRPGKLEDEILFAAMQPLLIGVMIKLQRTWSDFDEVPTTPRDEGDDCFCPRCHSYYLAGVESCRDCGDYPLRSFRKST